MGKEKIDLISIASETFSNFFSKASIVTAISSPAALKNHLNDSQEQAFQKIINEPIIIRLYFRFKGTASPIGASIEKYEKYWLDSMTENFMLSLNLNQQKALAVSYTILVLRLGLYHRIATAYDPAAVLDEARDALELIYLKLLT